MTDKELKILSDAAKAKLKNGITPEQARQSLVAAGIINDKGDYTRPYAILETVIKKK